MLLATCVLCGCFSNVPEPNIDPEVFRLEYEAVAREVAPPPLGNIVFVTMAWDELQANCWSPGCSGLHYRIEDTSVIFLPHPPRHWCRPSDPYAKTVVHELLHSAGMHHSDHMQQAEHRIWARYQGEQCEQPPN